MTNEEIIRMAHEAGLHIATDHDWMPIIALAYAKKFAEVARAAEREACAKFLLSTDLSGLKGNPEWQNFIANLLANYAAAIRARGQG